MWYSASNPLRRKFHFSALRHGDDGVVGRVVVCGWVSSSVQKKTSRRNTTTINLDLTTYDEREFLLFLIHMATCSTMMLSQLTFCGRWEFWPRPVQQDKETAWSVLCLVCLVSLHFFSPTLPPWDKSTYVVPLRFIGATTQKNGIFWNGLVLHVSFWSKLCLHMMCTNYRYSWGWPAGNQGICWGAAMDGRGMSYGIYVPTQWE